ncbi:hypothetical protein CYMTET_20268 [Cymbomonas tetramitiformis]|uniref:FHA domain-containing protein n=1 Tax=Cymbomonas tetramitiformis TaxID=36881 RepID=A0AAE0G4E3_9CHLO|nr:hypothetical protein CYMTET_20268 [Cymbomonas tetramitiformis]
MQTLPVHLASLGARQHLGHTPSHVIRCAPNSRSSSQIKGILAKSAGVCYTGAPAVRLSVSRARSTTVAAPTSSEEGKNGGFASGIKQGGVLVPLLEGLRHAVTFLAKVWAALYERVVPGGTPFGMFETPVGPFMGVIVLAVLVVSAVSLYKSLTARAPNPTALDELSIKEGTSEAAVEPLKAAPATSEAKAESETESVAEAKAAAEAEAKAEAEAEAKAKAEAEAMAKAKAEEEAVDDGKADEINKAKDEVKPGCGWTLKADCYVSSTDRRNQYVVTKIKKEFNLSEIMAAGKNTLVVGANPDCDLQFNVPVVSGVHAQLSISGNTPSSRITVMDLGSTNGTSVQQMGEAAAYKLVAKDHEVELTPGQMVKLASGAVKLKIEWRE